MFLCILLTGSRVHQRVREVVDNKFLTRDVGKISPLHQTYSLEVYQSVVNTFAPKNTHFVYRAMIARLVENTKLMYRYMWLSTIINFMTFCTHCNEAH